MQQAVVCGYDEFWEGQMQLETNAVQRSQIRVPLYSQHLHRLASHQGHCYCYMKECRWTLMPLLKAPSAAAEIDALPHTGHALAAAVAAVHPIGRKDFQRERKSQPHFQCPTIWIDAAGS